jgi:hypothetical protein
MLKAALICALSSLYFMVHMRFELHAKAAIISALSSLYFTCDFEVHVTAMDEGRERDHTSRRGGQPTLPGLYHSTIQPSQRGFFRVHVFV